MLDFAFHKIIASLKSLGITAAIVSLAVFFSAFSSMALLSMSDQFYKATVKDPASSLGGDVVVELYDDASIGTFKEDIANLQTSGKITSITEIGAMSGLSAKSSKSSKLEMLSLIGVSDNLYPLYGSVDVNGGLYNSVKENGTIVLTKDLAKKLNVVVGDSIQVVPSDIFASQSLKVNGIVESISGGNKGGMAYASLGTIENLGTVMKSFLIRGDESAIESTVSKFFEDGKYSGYYQTLSAYTKSQEKSATAFTLVFKGLSILGIFIGSIGIASSMQVIISRRKREIGIMKSIGYRETNIVFLYLLELLVLALPGILLGILGGYLLSQYILNLFTTIGMNVVFNGAFNFKVAGITFLASLGSALIFAFYSISKYASFSIVDALRENSTGKGKGKLRNLLLLVVIAALFAGLSILITGEWKFGLIAVGIAVGGTLLFSLIFQFIFWLVLRLPLNTGNVFEMAWINLRNSYKKNLLAVMAIFIGITAIGLLTCLIKTSKDEMNSQSVDLKSTVNIVAVKDYTSNSNLSDSLSGISSSYDTEYVKELSADTQFFHDVVGRDIKDKYLDMGITEGSLKEGNYVVILDDFKTEPDYAIGKTITIPDVGLFEISGYYASSQNSDNSGANFSLFPNYSFAIVTKSTFLNYFKDNFKEVAMVSADSASEDSVINLLQKDSNNVVLSVKATQEYMNSMFDMITKMVFSVAGLALLAGGILLLNSTSLEIISRRRSFGLLKVVGFTNRQVKWMLFLEYGLIFLITFAISYLTVWGGVKLLSNNSEAIFGYKYNILFAGQEVLYLMIGFGALIFVLIWSVAIKYLNTKPVDVLRYE